MFEEQELELEKYKKKKTKVAMIWTAIKLIIAYLIISQLEYGLYIVIGYLFYNIEKIAIAQFININEINIQLNMLHQKIEQLEKK